MVTLTFMGFFGHDLAKPSHLLSNLRSERGRSGGTWWPNNSSQFISIQFNSNQFEDYSRLYSMFTRFHSKKLPETPHRNSHIIRYNSSILKYTQVYSSILYSSILKLWQVLVIQCEQDWKRILLDLFGICWASIAEACFAGLWENYNEG